MARGDYYEDGSVTKSECPRCESSFMADHGDREHCGKCGYTEWA
jgi:small subunit ribosomal protein S27Ae